MLILFYRTSQLKSIDLSKEPIASNQAGPVSDIFILRFGLTHLNLSNCKIEDEVFINIHVFM